MAGKGSVGEKCKMELKKIASSLSQETVQYCSQQNPTTASTERQFDKAFDWLSPNQSKEKWNLQQHDCNRNILDWKLKLIVGNRTYPKSDECIRLHQSEIEDDDPDVTKNVTLAEVLPSGLETA